MKKTFITLALLVLIVRLTIAQQDQSVVDSDPNIRPAGVLTLKFEHNIKIPEIKRFENGVLELFPGDTVHLEFETDGEELVRPKIVAKVQHPKRTVTFKMTQDKSSTMLIRSSAIQKTIALDCEHRGLGQEGFSKTNLRPTEKGLMSADSWPNSVWTLRLSHIEVTSRSASEVYEEKVSKSRSTDQGKQ